MYAFSVCRFICANVIGATSSEGLLVVVCGGLNAHKRNHADAGLKEFSFN